MEWIDQNLILKKLVMKLFYRNPTQSNLVQKIIEQPLYV
jgi:hypothetical protein